MIHLRFYWKRFFRQHDLSARQAGLLLVLLTIFAGGVSLTWKKDEPEAVAVSPRAAAFVAPQPNLIAEYAPQSVESVKSVKPATPESRQSLSSPLSSIQMSIASMLEASSQFIVSEKKVVVDRGDTLMELLVKKAAVPRDEAYQVVQAISKIYNPREISPGREITVFFHKNPALADPKFSGVRIEKDSINGLTVNRDDSGHYTVKKVEKTVHRSLNGFKGTIDNSLYVDAQAAGVPDAVILSLIKMYSWNVDFQREIHPGDKFEIMYEEYKTEDGKRVHGKGNIVYAKLSLSGTDMPFYRFEDARGDADYYDHNGRSAKKPLMKTPVDGARLSSGFGMRKHPVLGYSKKHMGVDFAAPRGTPIYAAGDGTITKIGPFSSYGNYIRIRHRAGLDTAYAHMSRFKAGLRSGSRVKQGEVIGYIGTTGRSTGPHLHYEVIVNNGQVNPGSVKLPTGRTLKGKELKSFQRTVATAQLKFNGLGHSAVAENRPPAAKAPKIVKN